MAGVFKMENGGITIHPSAHIETHTGKYIPIVNNMVPDVVIRHEWPEEYESFKSFMNGKTCPVDGYYHWDVVQWMGTIGYKCKIVKP